MTDTRDGEQPNIEEATGEEREQLAQEGRLEQTEQEESQEDE
jgi:hypothetical protein